MSGQGYNFRGEKSAIMRKKLANVIQRNLINEYADCIADSEFTDDESALIDCANKLGITRAKARKLQDALDSLYDGHASKGVSNGIV